MRYGKCRCGRPVEIPGLEASYCRVCGWVIDIKGADKRNQRVIELDQGDLLCEIRQSLGKS